MAAWTERRGYTLSLSQRAAEQPLGRFVRLALVRRTGLLPLFNVAEARAERGDGDVVPRQVGEARLSSWRWLTQAEAEAALAHRLTTLERLGYVVSSISESTGGEWDWLRELVRHQLEGVRPAGSSHTRAADSAPTDADPAASPQAEAAFEQDGAARPTANAAPELTPDSAPDGEAEMPRATSRAMPMEEALGRLRVDARELVDRVARLVERRLEADTVDTRIVSFDDVEAVATLLPELLVHDDPAVRHVATRWLEQPTAAFELDRARLIEVSCTEHPLTHLLASTVRERGLALLGVEGVERVASEAVVEAMRDAAASWKARLP